MAPKWLSLGRRLGYVYVFVLLGAPLGYLIRWLYAQHLPVEQFGLFYSLIALLATLTLLSDLGLSQSVLYFIPKYRKDPSRNKSMIVYAAAVQIAAATAIGLGLFVLAPVIAERYFKSALALLPLRILSVYFILFTAGQLIQSLFKGFQDEKYWATYELIRLVPLLILSWIVLETVEQDLLTWLALVWLAAIAIRTISYVIILGIRYPFLREHPFRHRPEIASDLRIYSLNVLLAAGAGALLSNIDVILLTAMSSLHEVGLYNIAFPTAEIIIILVGPLTVFMQPLIASYFHEGKQQDIRSLLELIYSAAFFLILPSLALFFLYADIAVQLLFGAKFAAATPVLRILVLGMIFKVVYIVCFAALAATGHVVRRTRLVWSGLLLNLVLDIMLIPFFAASGAAAATSISLVYLGAMAYRDAKAVTGAKVRVRSLMKNIVNTLLFMALVVGLRWALPLPALYEVAVVLAVAGGAYLLAGVFVFRVVPAERIRSLLHEAAKERKTVT